MSQSVITKAFVEWKAQQAINNQPVVLDEFIFAYVPGLDISKPIPNTEGIPAADKIVHRQAVGKAGVVNLNAVVYSVTMGADVGDFDFNWIGLVNKASNTLAAIIHAPTQRKVKNASGQQGNVLTRSVLMEYNGAQTETQINVPAETWQIDFTARLAGMDEAVRLASLDIYGLGAFFDTGFLVAKTANQYFVTQGLGYIGGLRAVLAANQNITLAAKPTKVWADVCYHGTVTSAYRTEINITVAASLADYTENGIAHYVFALASIDAAGVITDLRPKGSLGEQQGNSDFLRKDDNLAALKDKSKSRGSLGLGTAATKNVGIEGGNVMTVGAFGLGGGSNHKADAYNNAGEIYRVNNTSANAPTTGVAGVVSLPCDGGPSTAYVAVSNAGAAWVGSSNVQANGVKWHRVYTTGNKPSAGDVDAYSKKESDDRYLKLTGGGLTGAASAPAFIGQNNGLRIHSEQDTTAQLLFANAAGNVTKGRFYPEATNDGHRMVLHAGANASNKGSYWIFQPNGSVIMPNSVVWAANGGSQGSIEAINFGVGSRISIMQWNMATAGTWGMYLDHDSGRGIGFGVNGVIKAAGAIQSDGEVNSGGEITWNHGNCRAYGDGNISGPIWGGYLRDWLVNNTISRVLRGAQGSMTMDGNLVEAPAGCVLTGGNGNEGNQVGVALYRPLQIWRSGYWQTIEG
ncbi:phage tail protein [Serratia proteamaculans]|uniref:Phage tail protein n=1 Tax=Serratia proteamaculans TaxID=28151 RepID=A0A5Q2VBK9_SERPR|nr:phage tail protein [Serratia proteamaculans]QGH60743.1 phage tail protein [Serratia proteamaculans]